MKENEENFSNIETNLQLSHIFTYSNDMLQLGIGDQIILFPSVI